MREVEDLPRDFVQVEGLEDGVALLQELAQSVDDRARPLAVLDHVVQRRTQLVQVERALIEETARSLRVGEDGGQRLTQLVRERTRLLGQDQHPIQMRELLALRGRIQLGALAVGDVPHDAEHLSLSQRTMHAS